MKLTLIATSQNRNAFGLRSFLFLAPDGRGWQALSASSGARPGDTLEFDVSACGEHIRQPFASWECTRRLPDTTAAKAQRIISDARTRAESLES